MLVAVGGHALLRPDRQATIDDQRAGARRLAGGLAVMIASGFQVVVTHGNGPQVGAAMTRSEHAREAAYPLPVDVCVASTQGEIGYLLQQALCEALGAATPVATVVTQVVVAADDPALDTPTKPIGPVFDEAAAAECRARHRWSMGQDGARGWRRLVASPKPVEVVERAAISRLADRGTLVIALGGGGIPVCRVGDRLRGVDAVVDKDHSSALLATDLGATHYVNVTDVDRVYLDYGDQRRTPLHAATAAELRAHLEAGHFPAGTMGPKVESALEFLARGGRHAVVTTVEQLSQALDPGIGTHITP